MKSDKVDFFLPVLFSASFFFPNGFKTAILILLFFNFLPLSGWQQKLAIILRYPLCQAFIGFFLFTSLSYFWSENKGVCIEEIISQIPFFLAPLFFLGENSKLEKSLSGLLYGFYFTGLFISLASVLNNIFFLRSGSFEDNFVYENLAVFSGMQPIYLSLYLIISSLAWYNLYIKNKISKSKIHLVSPAIFYTMVVLLSSRTELIIYSGGLFMIFINHFRSKKIIFFIISFIFMTITTCLILSNKTNSARFREMFDFKNDYHNNKWGGRAIRLEKWKNAMECYKKFPFLGTGAGDCEDELQKVYQKNEFIVAYNAHFNPHNQYLQTLLTLGPFGLILLLSIFGVAFFSALEKKDFIFFLLIYIFFGSMITESMLERQNGLFLFTVLIPLFAAYSKKSTI